MRRLLTFIAVALILSVVAVLPAPPSADPVPILTGLPGEEVSEPARFFHCPWSVRDNDRVSYHALVSANPTNYTISYLSNRVVESGPVGSLDSQSATWLENTRVVGNSPSLVELSNTPVAAAVVGTGGGQLTGYQCPRHARGTWHIPGGSTGEEESLTLYVLNPFTGDARMSVQVVSENGAEENRDLELWSVPARSIRSINLKERFAGRRSLAVLVDQMDGAVIPLMVWERETDAAAWSGVAAADVWEFAAAGIAGVETELVLSNDSPIEVTVDMEVFDEVGSLLDSRQYKIAGPGLTTVPLSEIDLANFGVQLIGDLPFGAVLVGKGESSTAVMTGSERVATEWLVPGPGAVPADYRLRVLNPGLNELDLTYREVGPAGPGEPKDLTLAGGTIATVELAGSGAGLVVSGTSGFSLAWWAIDNDLMVFGEGTPVDSGVVQ